MFKKIYGKRYDTKEAELLLSVDNGKSGGDHIKEELYRKKNCEFFLYVEGGIYTKYAFKFGSICQAGRDIIPMTYDAAENWMKERKMDDEIIRKYFGPVDRAGEKVNYTFAFDKGTIEKAKRNAAQKHMSLNRYVNFLIERDKIKD
jgi:hypothetical protein